MARNPNPRLGVGLSDVPGRYERPTESKKQGLTLTALDQDEPPKGDRRRSVHRVELTDVAEQADPSNHASALATICFASGTRNSPEMSFGSNASRRAANVWDS